VNKELVIDSTPGEVNIALLEDKYLVELHKDNQNSNFSVGDIFLGKVKKIVTGLNAAFIDVGYEKDGFLHYLDLGPQIKSHLKYTKLALDGKYTDLKSDQTARPADIDKKDKISNILKPNQRILVQIVKEPISTKGPRLTTELTFAGRFFILIPFADKISISQKIQDQDERSRLKRLVQSITPPNFGVIIRTVAENKMVAELDADMRDLLQKWEKTLKELIVKKNTGKIHGEINRTSSLLRDLLNESFNNIYVNNSILVDEIKKYISTIAPDKTDIVKLYKGKESIFEHFGIDRQIKTSFGKTVPTKNGAYVIIEHTEALHVVDVNSGHRVNAEVNQEGNASMVNFEAAKEIARQLRLRDMGGIIVIDFIDMYDPANRKKLYETMKAEMKNDRAKHTILPVNKFGLLQITRQRVRPEMNINTHEKCPSCGGTGEVKASIILSDEIERNIKYLLLELNHKKLFLTLHPFIYAFFTKGLYSYQVKWFLKYFKWIKLSPMPSYQFLEYHFFDSKGNEIKL